MGNAPMGESDIMDGDESEMKYGVPAGCVDQCGGLGLFVLIDVDYD
jgi:hypothetical protein